MSEQDKIAAIAARYDAAVDAVKRIPNPTRADVDRFVIQLANTVSDLIAVVGDHVGQPFTKAHDKGREP